VIASIALVAWRESGRDVPIKIATATEGGRFHSLGKALAAVLQKETVLPASTVSGAEALKTNGSSENIRGVLDGDYDVAFVGKQSLLTYPYPNDGRDRSKLRVACRVYSDRLHILMHRSLSGNTLEEVLEASASKRKTLNVYMGSVGSGTRTQAAKLLKGRCLPRRK